MRLDDMKTFISVVEAGSISAAAERLGIAKSAVSRRIARLEEKLDVQLFRRTTRSLNLTDTAASFYTRCVRILADVAEAEHSVAQEHGTLAGRLRVAMPYSFGLLHLGPAINEFMLAHPRLEFELDFNDGQVDILQGGFDVALRLADLPDSSLMARKLAPIHTLVCASPQYLQQHGTPQQPCDLTKHTCITYSNSVDPQTWRYQDKDGKPHSVRVSTHLLSNNGEFSSQAAIAGLGIIHQPTFMLYQAIEQGLLVPILTDYHWRGVNAYALYPQTRHLSQRVRAFVDFLAERFSGTPYWDAKLEIKQSPRPSN